MKYKEPLLSTVLRKLQLDSFEELYACFLSQAPDYSVIAAAAGLSEEETKEVLGEVKRLIGEEKVREMESGRLESEHLDMFTGLNEPEQKREEEE